MKKTIFILFAILTVSISLANSRPNFTLNDSIENTDSAYLFLDAGKCIHAIAFDNNGELYVAGCQDIYRINSNKEIVHIASLTDTTDKTIIWAMDFNTDNDLFIAAKDRIVKLDKSGKHATVIKENFDGPAGVSDVRFDKSGNLFAAYGNKIASYDSQWNKKIVVDGSKFDPTITWAVGIEFDQDENYLFIGDCNGQQLLAVPFKNPDYTKEIKTYPSKWGQYLTKDLEGNLYLTMLGKGTQSEFLRVQENMQPEYLTVKNKPFQDRKEHKKTIAYGSFGSDEEAIFCIIGNKIYWYPLQDFEKVEP